MTTTTVLLDLDDTLLVNDMHQFLPAYFEALQQRLHLFAGHKNLQQVSYEAVQMLYTKKPGLTNLEAFMEQFCQSLGYPAHILQPHLDRFYREDYPRLKAHTRLLPEAQQVVRRLLAGGYKVVVATNPLFPATGIEQRLQWAGLAGFPYALVTSMDNSYFCKPDVRYYQETLTRVGSSPLTTWMVGDDPANDIIPARTLGIKTWWITPSPSQSAPVEPAPETDQQGSLGEFLAWVEAGGLAAF